MITTARKVTHIVRSFMRVAHEEDRFGREHAVVSSDFDWDEVPFFGAELVIIMLKLSVMPWFSTAEVVKQN